MPSSKKAGRKTPVSDQKITATASNAAGNLTQQRFAGIGRNTRVQAHVSSQGKRRQAKRDSR